MSQETKADCKNAAEISNQSLSWSLASERRFERLVSPHNIWVDSSWFESGFFLCSCNNFPVMLNEAKTSRLRPELRGRGQDYEVEAKAEAKNNYEKSTK